MQYKIGEVYDFDGEQRKVIGADGKYPITTAVLEFQVEQPAPSVLDLSDIRAQIEAEIRAQIEAEIRAQIAAERADAANFAGLLARFPLDKCNKDELCAIAAYLGKDSLSNEDRSKAEIAAVILGTCAP